MTVVRINAITLNNNVADGNGARWYVTEMTGWDSPSVRQQQVDVPNVSLSVPTEGLYGARNITVAGVCKAPSKAAFYASWYYLSAQTSALRTPFVFSMEEDITRRCDVIRNGEIRMEQIGVGSFTFELLLRADDPFKYADALSTEPFNANVAETLNNAGSVVSYPVMTLDATGAPTIKVGAQVWSAASIPSGTVIDMKNQTILNGITNHFDKLVPGSQWLTLAPGNNTVESSVPMTVTWRGAWV